MEKIFNQKSFNYFVWTPLGSNVNTYINFCLQVLFKESAAWYFLHILPPLSLVPAAILPPVWQICHQCRDTGGAPWLANISANFRKKFETVLMGYSGDGGKLVRYFFRKWTKKLFLSTACLFDLLSANLLTYIILDCLVYCYLCNCIIADSGRLFRVFSGRPNIFFFWNCFFYSQRKATSFYSVFFKARRQVCCSGGGVDQPAGGGWGPTVRGPHRPSGRAH